LVTVTLLIMTILITLSKGDITYNDNTVVISKVFISNLMVSLFFSFNEVSFVLMTSFFVMTCHLMISRSSFEWHVL
jgi:uncharacterized membrane protein YGL010W